MTCRPVPRFTTGRPRRVFLQVHDLDGGLRAFRTAAVSPGSTISFPPHITIVHPRTSALGEQAWAELAACNLSIRFTVTCVAITAFDGDRWPALRVLHLAPGGPSPRNDENAGSTGHDATRIPPLPVRPRPRRSETADSYLRRLAAANHLRFTYLRRYIARPEGSYGPIDAAKLAVLACRELPAILLALPEAAPSRRPPARRYSREDIRHSHAGKRNKYAAIRRERHQRHVRTGLSSASTTSAVAPSSKRSHPLTRLERKKIHREPARPGGACTPHIDAMIKAAPADHTSRQIWERLADEHGTTVAFPTLRTYVTSHRGQGQTGQDQLSNISRRQPQGNAAGRTFVRTRVST